MATVYIKPGTGTGTGTASDPYFYSQLTTAETAAGAGGTILFTDGDYSLTGTTTWDGVGTSGNDITYKSLNLKKAVIKSSVGGTLRTLNIGTGSANTSSINVKNFKFIDINFYMKNPGEVSGNLITTSTAVVLPGINGFLRSTANATSLSTFINNAISFEYASGSTFERDVSSLSEFSGNTIYISGLSGKTADQLTWTYSAARDLRSCPIVKNNIFASDDTTGGVINTQNSYASSLNNCCFFQFDDSLNGSGGTGNVFADPQFVDAANDDLRLRPSSPCINAGTAS